MGGMECPIDGHECFYSLDYCHYECEMREEVHKKCKTCGGLGQVFYPPAEQYTCPDCGGCGYE